MEYHQSTLSKISSAEITQVETVKLKDFGLFPNSDSCKSQRIKENVVDNQPARERAYLHWRQIPDLLHSTPHIPGIAVSQLHQTVVFLCAHVVLFCVDLRQFITLSSRTMKMMSTTTNVKKN